MRMLRIGTLSAISLLLVLSAGCEGMGRRASRQAPSVRITASDRTMFAGESVLIFATSRNLIAADAEIEWESTIGELRVMDNGRRALFTSDVPGTAIITARVRSTQGTIADQARITINPVQ